MNLRPKISNPKNRSYIYYSLCDMAGSQNFWKVVLIAFHNTNTRTQAGKMNTWIALSLLLCVLGLPGWTSAEGNYIGGKWAYPSINKLLITKTTQILVFIFRPQFAHKKPNLDCLTFAKIYTLKHMYICMYVVVLINWSRKLDVGGRLAHYCICICLL